LVRAEQLTKTFQGKGTQVTALRGVDLTIARGEFLAIMGPSGSGKSTLLHLLGCLEQPTSGTYLLDQHDVSRLSDRRRANLRSTQIGFVFQTFNLVHQLSVLQNVELPFLYRRDRSAAARKKARKSVALVGLSHRAHHRPYELSGGEMQRAAIARAIAVEPLLVLADEPTGNLDSQTGDDILNLFRNLNQAGTTLAVVTHNPNVAAKASRVVQLNDGRVDGPTDAQP